MPTGGERRGTLPRGARYPTRWGDRRGTLPRGPGPHRVGRAMEGTTLRGALPRGLGLSLEKAQTKEHQGAAAPWTPGEAKVLAGARRVLGL